MTFSADDLSGRGTIVGVPIRCVSVEMQFRGHTGCELPERQIADLELLRERLGAEPTRQLARDPHFLRGSPTEPMSTTAFSAEKAQAGYSFRDAQSEERTSPPGCRERRGPPQLSARLRGRRITLARTCQTLSSRRRRRRSRRTW